MTAHNYSYAAIDPGHDAVMIDGNDGPRHDQSLPRAGE